MKEHTSRASFQGMKRGYMFFRRAKRAGSPSRIFRASAQVGRKVVMPCFETGGKHSPNSDSGLRTVMV